MLTRVADRARRAGAADRVRTVRAEIGVDVLPGPVDVAWSSAVMHEIRDPRAAFGAVFDALRPGGLLVVVEMDGLPRLLPAGFAAFEERLRAAGAQGTAEHRPDWAPVIRATGFDLVDVRQLTVDTRMPAAGPAGDYARLELQRLTRVSTGALDDADRATLATLTGDGPGRVGELGELWIRGARTLWAARRP
jgi:SAM-dependent methyltransferase